MDGKPCDLVTGLEGKPQFLLSSAPCRLHILQEIDLALKSSNPSMENGREHMIFLGAQGCACELM